jgi:hypothetical protein
MPDAGNNCRKCRYLGMTHSHSNGASISVPGCRRRAPIVGEWTFPSVDPERDWCGEFEPLPEEA